jgi:hypothetical protein
MGRQNTRLYHCTDYQLFMHDKLRLTHLPIGSKKWEELGDALRGTFHSKNETEIPSRTKDQHLTEFRSSCSASSQNQYK